MRGQPAASVRRSAGFTLVELLVAVAILIILAAIVVAFLPNVLEQDRPARGADRLQEVLLIARQRAVRDRAPRGVRIQPVDISLRVSAQPQPLGGNSPLSICRVQQVAGVTELGWPWALKVGMPLFVSDPDPTDPTNPAKFFNPEVVRIVQLNHPSAPLPNFVAAFSRPHGPFQGLTSWFNLRVLAYSTDVQYTEVPPDYVVRWTFAQPGAPPGESTRELEIPGGVDRNFVFLDRRDNVVPGTLFTSQMPPPYILRPGSPSGNPAVRDFSDNRWFLVGPSGLTIGTDSAAWPVQAGDYLQMEDNITRRITQVTHRPLNGTGPLAPTYVSTSPLSILEADTLILDSILPDYLNPGYTPNYKILRGPRVLAGETPVSMPYKVAIDLDTNFTYGEPLPLDPNSGAIDIVFAPDGRVITNGASNNKFILWLRDPTGDGTKPGTQTLICIHVSTGAITSHPVDITPGVATPYRDPYSFTRSDRASGL